MPLDGIQVTSLVEADKHDPLDQIVTFCAKHKDVVLYFRISGTFCLPDDIKRRYGEKIRSFFLDIFNNYSRGEGC